MIKMYQKDPRWGAFFGTGVWLLFWYFLAIVFMIQILTYLKKDVVMSESSAEFVDQFLC